MFRLADKADPSYCFPNRLEDINVLKMAVEDQPECPKAYYYLGNIWYDKRQYKRKQKENWEMAAKLDPQYPTVFKKPLLLFITINQMNRRRPVRYWKRRLALTHQMPEFSLNLISYTKNFGMSTEDRIAFYEKYADSCERDDVFIEYNYL